MEKRKTEITEISLGKVPPQDTIIEEAILGSIMIDNSIFGFVRKHLKPECFYNRDNGMIFSEMIDMNNKGLDVDLLSVTAMLREKGTLDDIGGPYRLSMLTSNALPSSIQTHVMIIFELWLKREVIAICYETINDVYSGEFDILDVKEKLLGRIEQVFDVGAYERARYTDLIDKVLENISATYELGYNPDLLTTDTFLDRLITIKPNNIIFVASMEKHGKTKIMMYLIHKLFEKYEDRIATCWYSMEDDADKIIKNRISIETGLSYNFQCGEEGKMNMDDITIITTAANRFRKNTIEFVDEPTKMSLISNHFRNFCKRNEDKINILVIDNFFISAGLEDTKENDTARESRVASYIQNLNASLQAQGYKALIIVLDHLKKELFENRIASGYRPLPGMLKGSGRKGQILTQLILLNQAGMHPDLVGEEEQKSPVKIFGNKYNRRDLIKHLIILEKLTSRNSRTSDIIRVVADLGTMKFYDIENAYKLIPIVS